MFALAGRLPISEHADGRRYFTRTGARRGWLATPLLLALLTLAVVDVVFAVDSVPAIFAVTSDAWIVFAANAFALLGMRPMYFLLAEGINRLAYLQRGLAIILIGIGVEMLLGGVDHDPGRRHPRLRPGRPRPQRGVVTACTACRVGAAGDGRGRSGV